MDMSDLLTLVLILLGVLALLVVAVIGFAMWRYRIPPERADCDDRCSGLSGQPDRRVA
jgi:uncharacterized iron-regulated membrane protein